MRFDSAREAGLEEARAQAVLDMPATNAPVGAAVDEREALALALTDVLLGTRVADAELREQLSNRFTAPELAELSLGVGLFLGMSKVLITLGLEPEDMPVTVVPTPGA